VPVSSRIFFFLLNYNFFNKIFKYIDSVELFRTGFEGIFVARALCAKDFIHDKYIFTNLEIFTYLFKFLQIMKFFRIYLNFADLFSNLSYTTI